MGQHLTRIDKQCPEETPVRVFRRGKYLSKAVAAHL